jgi:carbonic anhydrase/acetyltransferase-like protein (isoleucine patch superfamily)
MVHRERETLTLARLPAMMGADHGVRMPIYELNGAKPELPADGEYWIAPTATLIGKVRLARGASIWFGAILRGDNDWISIGENSNIQDGSILHTDDGVPLTIGANVTIGHAVVLHGAAVGDNALIGMSATLLNRARVGTSSIVGAHALLPEGKQYPEKSLIVGVPARVVRSLTAEEAALLPLSAKHYVANAERYRRELKDVRQ